MQLYNLFTLFVITLRSLLLAPLLLERLDPLYAFSVPVTAFPLCPLLVHTSNPLTLPTRLSGTLIQRTDCLIGAVTPLQINIYIPHVALLRECGNQTLEDGTATLGIAIGAFEFERCKFLRKIAVLRRGNRLGRALEKGPRAGG